jgi:hypothetical protein
MKSALFAALLCTTLLSCGSFDGHLHDSDSHPESDHGWVDLFNGDNLDGWARVNGAPSTFTVRDGMIVCSGKPISVLRTDRMYENFVFEMNWKHIEEQGNAGLFIWSDPLTARGQPFTRSIEVQVMVGVETENYTSDGDIFSIHGATMVPDRPHPGGWARCLPSEKRVKPAGNWNHYRVTCIDGVMKLDVNGKEVSGGYDMSPRKGYICLEAEGSEIHFKKLRIRELPPSDPPLPAEHVADLARDHTSLYSGEDLSGWQVGPAQADHWSATGWTLSSDGFGGPLMSQEQFGEYELIVDWRWTGEAAVSKVTAAPSSSRAVVAPGTGGTERPAGQWNRMEVTRAGGVFRGVLNGEALFEHDDPDPDGAGPIVLMPGSAPVQFANVYVRRLP